MKPSLSESPAANDSALLGFGERVRLPNGRIRIRLRWGRIALLMLSCAILGWTAKSVALYYIFTERQGFKEATFTDAFIFPFNRTSFRHSFGDWQVEQAKTALQNGDARTGMLYLGAGVARSPGNTEGRLMLSEFERMRGRPDNALRIIREGLPYNEDDMDYLKLYLRVLLNERYDEELQAFAQERLSGTQERTQENLAIAFAAAQSHNFRGQFDVAEQYLQDFGLDEQPSGVAILGRILWSQGMKSEAIKLLEDYVNQNPRAWLDPVYGPLCHYLREEGRLQEALRYALIRSTTNPDKPEPTVELIQIYKKMKDDPRVAREVESYIRQFGSDEKAMQLLGDFATSNGDVKLSRRIYEKAITEGHRLDSFGLLYIEAHLKAGNYKQANELCQELEQESPDWLRRSTAQFQSLRAISAFGMGATEQGQYAMSQFLESGRVTAPELIAIGRLFRQAGFPRQALRILRRATEIDSSNQLALAEIVEIELAGTPSNDFPQYIQALLNLRRTSHDLLERSKAALASDRFLFTPNRPQLLDRLNASLGGQNAPTPASL